MSKREKERRFYKVELRTDEAEGGKPKMSGYAAVFEQLSSDLGGFREKIAKGAFADSVGKNDVLALFNHDPNQILGRSGSGTLKLSEDDHGLAIEIDPPDTQLGRDLSTLMQRGDISQMSFGFYVKADHWEKVGDAWERTLLDVDLIDVSPVTVPAYPQTEVALRALSAAIADLSKPFAVEAEARKRVLALKK